MGAALSTILDEIEDDNGKIDLTCCTADRARPACSSQMMTGVTCALPEPCHQPCDSRPSDDPRLKEGMLTADKKRLSFPPLRSKASTLFGEEERGAMVRVYREHLSMVKYIVIFRWNTALRYEA